ncbi:hypothetical protein A9Q84_06120 [Halobacteriovorax marinus]|uniref:Uncharacterized protein n=1 Tax=Halobacteriovorax marinus TaxID=97084 RepID=A0A1Y5FDI8_9BACT|nr:hypothetical protein A9Q84_06120 [Halobacteriovorax marinus]
MNKKILLIIVFPLLFSLTSMARDWVKFKIPEAKCGDGTDYSVYYNPQNSKKLLVEFMMGGACWDLMSCYGGNIRTWLHPIIELPSFSVLSSNDSNRSPFTKHSSLYLPYCTGDVFAGDHKFSYFLGIKANHVGHSNIVKTVKFFKENGIIQFSKLEELILFGTSAGAIGTLIHSKTFEREVSSKTKKVIIADSPGLHFGKKFWKKFTNPMRENFQKAFNNINVHIDFDDGLVADQMDKVCDQLPDWNIGFLQGSQDLIMTLLFGNITPAKHRELVYGPRGIHETTKYKENCASFVADTKMHTFLLLNKSSQIKAGGITALDFAKRVYQGKLNRSYR